MSAGGDSVLARVALRAQPYPCFACGADMTVTLVTIPQTGWHGWCPRCEVTELRLPGPQVSRTAAITSVRWGGERLRYLDHGAGHYPSPA